MINKENLIASMFFIALIFFSNLVQGAGIPEVEISQPPVWVESIAFDEDGLKNKSDVSGGSYYLLVDQQTNVIQEKYKYNHYAIKLLNENAVEDNSRISITFSPEFQSLVIHKVVIWRNGSLISQLAKSNIKLLQREKELEKSIYDGRWTATIFLEDVRKEDVIEYSYTIKGQNPAYNKNISETVYLQWSVPISRQAYRLLWPETMPIKVTAENKIKREIRVSNHSGYKKYKIDIAHNATIDIDSETPEWFDPWQRVSFSSVRDWKEVVNWGLKHYQIELKPGSEVNNLAEKLRSSNKSKLEQASAALQYVQDEVRYLGIEVGSGSFIPRRSKVTLKRRYGDCKDKTYLLLDILNALNIEAYPVLANTRYGENLGEYGPGLNAFNHVFVKAVIDGKPYWLETTINNQAGTLDKIFQPDYGQVLVLMPGNDSLTVMSIDNGYHKVTYNEEFDLSKGVNREAGYTVSTIYRGYEAEKFRRKLNSKGKKKLAKEYLDFYLKYYKNISVVDNMSVKDDRKLNKISTIEKYIISDMWEDNKEEERYYAYIYSNSIDPYLNKPKVRKRTSPFEYSQLVNIEQNISVLLPGTWEIEADYAEQNTPFFNFSQKTTYNGNERRLQLKYKFKSLKKYIAVSEIDAYLDAVDNAYKNMNYQIYSPYPNNMEILKWDYENPLAIILIIFITVVVILIYCYIEFRMDQKKLPSDLNFEYFPVSSSKVFILTLFTGGFYLFYWFYKNWHYVKQREQRSIIPWGRALFYSLWYYPLYKSFSRVEACPDIKPLKLNDSKYAILAILFLISAILSNVDHVILYLGIIMESASVLPIVKIINNYNIKDDTYFKFNSRWRPRHVILAFLFIVIASFDIAERVNLIPSDTVVQGESLWKHDIKRMYRLGVISPEEKLILFYSTAFINYTEEGNGLSDAGVFSYWRDEKSGEIKTEIAKFNEITGAKNNLGKFGVNNIKIIRKDGSEFIIHAKSSKKLDFYKTLMQYMSNIKRRKNTANPEEANSRNE